MSAPIEPHEIGWKTPGPVAYAGLGLVVVGLYVAISAARPTIRDANVSGEVAESEAFEADSQRQNFEKNLAVWQRTISGRSPFFVPPAPVIEDPEPEPEQEEEEPDDRPEPTPRRYGGPDVIAVMNGRVWLDDDAVIKVGEEHDGVRLVHIDNSPWSVRVEWRGKEFDVELFERNTDRFLSNPRDDG